MKKRQVYYELIEIVNHVLHGTILPSHIHWDRVIAIAQQHRLPCFVYRSIAGRQDLSSDLVQQIETIYFTVVGEQVRQNHYAERLFDALHTQQIKYMPLKGHLLRELYPQQSWRTSSDLEILCDADRMEEVQAILSDFGFSRTTGNGNGELWVLDHVNITLHSELPSPLPARENDDEDRWARFLTEDGIAYRMTDEDYCIEMMTQMSQAVFRGQISIRMILDLYIYRHAKTELNRDVVAKELEKNGLLKFTVAMEALCEVWFGGKEQTNETMLLGSFIAANSAYGGRDKESKKALQGATRTSAFPAYRTMRRQYPVLKYCPFLFPFCWLIWEISRLVQKVVARGREGYRISDDRRKKMIARVEEITGLTAPLPKKKQEK